MSPSATWLGRYRPPTTGTYKNRAILTGSKHVESRFIPKLAVRALLHPTTVGRVPKAECAPGLAECVPRPVYRHRAQPDCRGVPSSLQCGGLGVWGVFWGVSTRVRIVLGSSVCGFKRVLSQVSPSRKGKLSRIPFSPSAAPLLEVREGRARERERERELYPLEGVVPQAELSPIFFWPVAVIPHKFRRRGGAAAEAPLAPKHPPPPTTHHPPPSPLILSRGWSPKRSSRQFFVACHGDPAQA